MAEYLIQDTTLDAIADAINAKTGGSSAMTPAQMVTAIGSIETGGGGLTPVLVTVTGGSANDVLTQCRAAVGSQQVFVINAQKTAVDSPFFLYYGIYVGITNANNTRYFNQCYRKNSSGNYALIEFTSKATSAGTVESGSQFYVWNLEGVFVLP